jgi:hypothetical protein
MRKFGFHRSVFAGWLMVVFVITFQNCGSYQSFQVENPKTASLSSEAQSGNGHGYGGKPYVILRAAGRCADGLAVESMILVGDDNRSFLMRANCRDITPPQPVTVSISSDQASLSYAGLVFTLESIATVTAPTPAPTAVPTTMPTTMPTMTVPGPLMRNFVAGTQSDCENSISSSLGITRACSIGGGCSLDGQVPSAANPSANAQLWGACFAY